MYPRLSRDKMSGGVLEPAQRRLLGQPVASSRSAVRLGLSRSLVENYCGVSMDLWLIRGNENRRCPRDSGDPLSVQGIPASAGVTRFSDEPIEDSLGNREAAVAPTKAGIARPQLFSNGPPLPREHIQDRVTSRQAHNKQHDERLGYRTRAGAPGSRWS